MDVSYRVRSVDEELGTSPLLESCRRRVGVDEEEIPQPVWALDRKGRLRTCWYDHPDRLKQTKHVLVPENGRERDPWWFTLRFWQRYGGSSPLEIGFVVRFLRGRGLGSEAIRNRVFPLLDVPASPLWVEVYDEFADYDDNLRDRIHQGEVSPRAIRFVRELPDALAEAYRARLGAGDVDLSVQETRRLADAARRLPESRHETWLKALRNRGEDVSPRQHGRNLLDRTRDWAFPSLRERREAFQRDRQQLDLNGKIRVEPPDNFEGDYLDFQFRCHRDDSYDSFLEDLEKCRKLFKHV